MQRPVCAGWRVAGEEPLRAHLTRSRRALAIPPIFIFNLTLRHRVLQPDVPAAELVPGDVVHINVGDKVPADVRIIRLKTTCACCCSIRTAFSEVALFS